MGLELALALLSTVLSGMAISLAWYVHHDAQRASVRPVLVFTFREEGPPQLKNVGTGPALNIVVGDGAHDGTWVSTVLCFPLAAGDSASIPWMKVGERLDAVYDDVHRRPFTTVAQHNRQTIHESNLHPEWGITGVEWAVLNVERHRSHWESHWADLDAFELDVLRNEPLARVGYIFKRSDLQAHFESCGWYERKEHDLNVARRELTRRQRDVMNYIKSYQVAHGKTTPEPTAGPDVVS